MIKFSARKNLMYYLLLVLTNIVRRIILMITDSYYPESISVFYNILMFFGEMSSGIIIHMYQEKSTKKKIINEKIYSIIAKKYKNFRTDSKLKIYSLLAMSSFFDFTEMYISYLYIPKLTYISASLEDRLCGSLIIFNTLIYHYILKFPLFKHQIFSLIVIGSCLFIIIFSECFFQKEMIDISIFKYVLLIIFTFFELFFVSMMDSVDKYLMEFNSINPCIIIIFEGLFGTIYSLISFFDVDLKAKMKFVINEAKGNSLGLFIFLLFIIYALSGITNIYRVYTNKVYNPMTESLAYYCLNPFYIIYDFFSGNDFIIRGEKNYFYFVLNLILSIIISLTGFIFNEFIVVFCCGLERETYQEISRRSLNARLDHIELNKLLKDEDNEESENENETDEEKMKNTYTVYI